MGQKPTKAIPAPTTAPEGHPILWGYQEEPDVVPAEEPTQAEKPTQATPAPAPRGQKGIQRPGMTTTMPWDYREEPDVEGAAS
jgi:hypothetical protein